MAWIESHQELRNHPKLSAVCRTLSAERNAVIGSLHCLWWWCMDYAMDGDISKFDSTQVADAAEWAGDADKFEQALIASGFIEKDDAGKRIHDWFDFCGELVHKRLRRKTDNRRKTAEIGRLCLPKSAEMPPTNQPNQPNQTDLTNQPTKTHGGVEDAPKGAFDLIWKKYPSRTGMKLAKRHFEASVKTMVQWLDIQKALDNYLKSDRVKRGYIQNGSTWFNNWTDWTNYTETNNAYANRPVGGYIGAEAPAGKYATVTVNRENTEQDSNAN